MLIALNPERQTERLDAVRKSFLSPGGTSPTPFEIYHLYEALKAGFSGYVIRNYFRRMPNYSEIEGKLAEALSVAELEFASARYQKSMS